MASAHACRVFSNGWPDVACLQELKTPDASFPIDAIREAGYHAIWHGQKSFNGVAILATKAASPSSVAAACPATPTTRIAATSRPSFTVLIKSRHDANFFKREVSLDGRARRV